MDYEYLDYLVEQVSMVMQPEEFITESIYGTMDTMIKRIQESRPDSLFYKVLKYYEDLHQDVIPFKNLKLIKKPVEDNDKGYTKCENYMFGKSIVMFQVFSGNDENGNDLYGFNMIDRIASVHTGYYKFAWGMTHNVLLQSAEDWYKSTLKEMRRYEMRHGTLNRLDRLSSIGKTDNESVSLGMSYRGVSIKISRADIAKFGGDEEKALNFYRNMVRKVMPTFKKKFPVDEEYGFRNLIFSHKNDGNSLGLAFEPSRKEVDAFIRKKVPNALDAIYVKYDKNEDVLMFLSRYNAFNPADPTFFNGDYVDMINFIDARTGTFIKSKIFRKTEK